MNNYGKAYHKGRFRNGEWGNHLRPFQKKLGNKRWRKTSMAQEKETILGNKISKKPKKITVKITKTLFGNRKVSSISKYRSIRDAKNAMNQAGVIQAIILTN